MGERSNFEAVDLIQTIAHRYLPLFAWAILALSLTPSGAQAGPTIPNAARADFQDPLANARPLSTAIIPDTAPNRVIGPDGNIVRLESDIAPLDSRTNGGLEQVQTDEIARTVRDEFLGQGRPAEGRDNATNLDSIVDQPDGSSSGIIRALINSVPGEPSANEGPQGRQSAGGNASTPSLLDETLTNLIVTVLNPSLTAEGIVTFSIAGFGDFALLLLQESGGIFLVDMENGTAVKFAEGNSTQISGPISRKAISSGQQDLPPSNALQQVLEILHNTVLPIVTSPITLATIALFSIIWVVWRLSARE